MLAVELGNLVLGGRYVGSAMSLDAMGGVRVGLWMGELCWSRLRESSEVSRLITPTSGGARQNWELEKQGSVTSPCYRTLLYRTHFLPAKYHCPCLSSTQFRQGYREGGAAERSPFLWRYIRGCAFVLVCLLPLVFSDGIEGLRLEQG